MMIELYKRYTYTPPLGQISITGIALIKNLIFRANLPALPENWQWTWLVERGEYRGTFPRRAASYYRRAHNIRCEDSFVSELGNLARAHTEDGTVYVFEFVDRLDWRAGDYGDAGSCLWGTYRAGREIMQQNGVWAVRFYDGDGKGFARAWFYVVSDHPADWYLLWNGYGFAGDSTLIIARIVAQFLELAYKEIDLTNHGDDTGVVYINSGRGFALSTEDILKGIQDFDFEWDTDSCSNCGAPLTEDDWYRGPDGDLYCYDCFYHYFQDCYSCGEAYGHDDVTYIESTGEWICERCLERWYTKCWNCEEFIARRSSYPHEGQRYCRDCFDALRPIYWE